MSIEGYRKCLISLAGQAANQKGQVQSGQPRNTSLVLAHNRMSKSRLFMGKQLKTIEIYSNG